MPVEITDRAVEAVAGAATNTGVVFVVDLFERGPTEPTYVRNLDEAVRSHGERVTYGLGYDWLDTAFADGLGGAWLLRRVGPSAARSTLTLVDGDTAHALTVDARDPGSHGDRIKAQVVAGSTGSMFTLVITYDDVEVERWVDLASPADAEARLADSAWVRGTAEAGDNPAVVAATALTGGDDDRANVDDDTLAADLARITEDYGPGQVVVPLGTTDTARAAIRAHCDGSATNRTPLLDVPAGTGAAALATIAATQHAAAEIRKPVFGNWLWVRGVAGGTRRLVPPSALAAALASRNDATAHPINSPAGRHGRLAETSIVIDVEQTFTAAEQTMLREAGVNVVLSDRRHGIHMATWRNTYQPKPNGDPGKWAFLADVRTAMKLIAEGKEIAHEFLNDDPIDGPGGFKLSGLRGALLSMMDRNAAKRAFYSPTGDTADAVYDVDLSGTTAAVIGQGRIVVQLPYTLAGTAETIALDFVRSTIA